jgi:hypothetical protein
VLVNAEAAADAVGVPCTTELLIGYPPSQIAEGSKRPRRFTVHVSLGAELTTDQLDRLYKVAVGCPVCKALEGGAKLTEIIEARPAAAWLSRRGSCG